MILLMASSVHLKLSANVTQLSSQLYHSSRIKSSGNKSGKNILLINLRTFLRIRQQMGVSADGGNLLIILHIFLIFQ